MTSYFENKRYFKCDVSVLQYVLVRRMSQGNLTKQQLISCLYKRSHYRDQQQIVGPYLDFIYTLIKKTKFQESIHNTEIQDFNSKVCIVFFFFCQNS